MRSFRGALNPMLKITNPEPCLSSEAFKAKEGTMPALRLVRRSLDEDGSLKGEGGNLEPVW